MIKVTLCSPGSVDALGFIYHEYKQATKFFFEDGLLWIGTEEEPMLAATNRRWVVHVAKVDGEQEVPEA